MARKYVDLPIACAIEYDRGKIALPMECNGSYIYVDSATGLTVDKDWTQAEKERAINCMDNHYDVWGNHARRG